MPELVQQCPAIKDAFSVNSDAWPPLERKREKKFTIVLDVTDDFIISFRKAVVSVFSNFGMVFDMK